ncbi:MAG: hypothetical protein ACREVH_02085 [Gammaproteobacteria bacterium]
MAHRVNIMLEDGLWKNLKQVPAGERSRVVNEAIADWLKARRRAGVARKMDALRARMPVMSVQELATWLREDRARPR